MNHYLEEILPKFTLWRERATEDKDVAAELSAMQDNEEKITDAFYRDLEFGTGGLRGVIGAGTNRMNVYTVAKASQGLANYVIDKFPVEERKIAVSYDSRIKSDLFARVAAEVFAANGIKVYIYSELMPTPCLSYAVRNLHCAAGVMVTASHNPAEYNGYKVYGGDGCQITTRAAAEVLREIENTDEFDGVRRTDFASAVASGKISYIPESVYTAFIEEVKNQSVLYGEETDKNVSIVYSPLNGTGLKPVLRALRESGFSDVKLVEEQALPDGNFPTCPYPNPEIKEAMSLGMGYAKKANADLLIATDPDCDRVGIAVKDESGEYILLSGNQTGVLLLDFICSQRKKHGTMPENPVFVKTIVTSDMAERVALGYGVKTVNVLTGFKFIGEQIGALESAGAAGSYIFGFEESYGYLSGSYVRDKDAVNGALLVCEMFAYYKTRGISLIEKLKELYKKYGYSLNTLHSYKFAGADGFIKMQNIMSGLRRGVEKIGGVRVLSVIDYALGVDGLPKSDVIKFFLEGDCTAVVRPSGTEPKLKTYISVCAADERAASETERKISCGLETFFK